MKSLLLSLIKSLFKWTHEEGFIIKNPASKLKEPKLGKRIPKFFSEVEGDKEREVYFNVRCAIWLKGYLDERDDGVFVTERKPKRRMSIDSLRYIVKRISSRAGIKKAIHPHQLRHSYATHMVDNGAPLEVIQSLLGHEKSETTRIYAHLSGKLGHDLYSKYF